MAPLSIPCGSGKNGGVTLKSSVLSMILSTMKVSYYLTMLQLSEPLRGFVLGMPETVR